MGQIKAASRCHREPIGNVPLLCVEKIARYIEKESCGGGAVNSRETRHVLPWPAISPDQLAPGKPNVPLQIHEKIESGRRRSGRRYCFDVDKRRLGTTGSNDGDAFNHKKLARRHVKASSPASNCAGVEEDIRLKRL